MDQPFHERIIDEYNALLSRMQKLMNDTSVPEHAPEPEPKEWRAVIIGLPTIRKLLNGEEVTIESFRINLIPDDVLWRAKPTKDIGK